TGDDYGMDLIPDLPTPPKSAAQRAREQLGVVDDDVDDDDGYVDEPRNPAASTQPTPPPIVRPPVTKHESLVHIPCPNGHELEVPLEMIGHRAACPHCGVQFRLKREDSVEFLHQQEIIDRRRGNTWFQIAIIAASFVVMLLLVIVILMVGSD